MTDENRLPTPVRVELEALRQRQVELEAQLAEYRRQVSLHRALGQLQEEIWKMQRTEDIPKVLKVLQEILGDLGIAFLYCSVNVVDTRQDPPTVSAFNIAQSGDPKFFPLQEESARNIVQFWQAASPVYRPHLQVEDAYQERAYLSDVGSVIDVPFSHGTLALSHESPEGFSPSDIATLQQLTQAISSAYSRYLDFQKMEEQNRQLTVERVAERVRMAVSVMKTAEDLKDVVEVMLDELARAGVVFDLCIINIVDEKAQVCRQYGATRQGWSGQTEMPLSQVSEAFLSVYLQQKSEVRPVDKGLATRYVETRRQLGITDPGNHPTALAEAPFTYGTLWLSTHRPEGFHLEEVALLEELARVIELGYARFQDLQRIETQRGLTRALIGQSAVNEFIGSSPALSRLEVLIDQVAATDLTVLILGETGTGKGVAARALHARSQRRSGPFIQVNCGAIAEGLVESELFGHEKGSFTGATARQLGKVELAEGGTLLLDEIGDMPLAAQVKLLQVLQEHTFERVGGRQNLRVDVRILAATNRDLPRMVAEERFREDLFFRLNTFPLLVPSLRQRRSDIPLLAEYFAERFAHHLNRSTPAISPRALKQLQDYAWPGNVRELEHLIQRAVLLCQGGCIEVEDVTVVLNPEKKLSEVHETEEEILPLAVHEKRYLMRVLGHTRGVVSGAKGAARLLEIHPETLRARMRKHGLR